MLKSIEDINTTKKRLRIEIPSDVIEKEIESSLEKLRQRVKLPGFRLGKAPINLIEKRFGKEVEAEVLENVIPTYYSEAMREADLKPVTLPVLDEDVDFKRKNPLNLLFTIEVLPKIDNLAYENIQVKDILASVEDADIENALNKLQDKKAIFETADKKIEKDDLVIFDYADSELVSGEKNPALKEIVSKMGNEIFPPDIMEKVLEKKKGDIVEFSTMLNDSVKPKELAGKAVNLKVLIKEIKKKTLPAIDDEFAKDLGFENISKLREHLKEKILDMKKANVRKIQKAEIVNRLLESYTFDVPESMLKREFDSLMFEGNLPQEKRQGEELDPLSDTDIVESKPQESSPEQQKDNVEDVQEKLEQKALRNVQASILIDLIGQKEGITVSDMEVEEHISIIAQRLSATPEALKKFYQYKEGSLDGLRQSIFQEKVLEVLLSKANIEKEENV